ncbi:hypothetical protein [Vibrio nigripulchritudo]|uniref:hypothetical protein n=1 Tax=Vibrio nigripulchritudo TaxID=28173 RepID=UPI002490A045|nr:hypothetical protein [Vibrio nigripulchritudo]BDU36004.1 hypothetical protein TUMSATVNIG2_04730 [Vibrio nigripulchritudo]
MKDQKLDKYRQEEVDRIKGHIEYYEDKISNLYKKGFELSKEVFDEYKELIKNIDENNKIDVNDILDFNLEDIELLIGDVNYVQDDINFYQGKIEDYEKEIEEIKNKKVFKEGLTFEEYKEFLESYIEYKEEQIEELKKKEENFEQWDAMEKQLSFETLAELREQLKEYKDEYNLLYGI